MVKQQKRASIDEILNHDWMQNNLKRYSVNLKAAQNEMQQNFASRRFKRGINKVIALNRMAGGNLRTGWSQQLSVATVDNVDECSTNQLSTSNGLSNRTDESDALISVPESEHGSRSGTDSRDGVGDRQEESNGDNQRRVPSKSSVRWSIPTTTPFSQATKR